MWSTLLVRDVTFSVGPTTREHLVILDFHPGVPTFPLCLRENILG